MSFCTKFCKIFKICTFKLVLTILVFKAAVVVQWHDCFSANQSVTFLGLVFWVCFFQKFVNDFLDICPFQGITEFGVITTVVLLEMSSLATVFYLSAVHLQPTGLRLIFKDIFSMEQVVRVSCMFD